MDLAQRKGGAFRLLSKDKRLNLKKDFKWVANGRSLETIYQKLFIKFGNNLTAKVGIATSGKFFKKAFERNRARRITSEALEALYEDFPERLNIIALPKAGVLNVKSTEVLFDLKSALKKEGIL